LFLQPYNLLSLNASQDRSARKLKILSLVETMEPAGGVERVVAALSGVWGILGHQVIVATKRGSKSFFSLDNRAELISFDFREFSNRTRLLRALHRAWEFLLVTRRVVKLVRSRSVDVVYTTSPLDFAAALIASLFSLRSITVIASEHGAFDAFAAGYRVIRWLTYRFAWAVVVPRSLDLQRFTEIGAHAFNIPHPLLAINTPESHQADRQNFALAAGRLVHDKGFDLLLRAWARVVPACENWKLKIAGDGPLKDMLISLSKELQIEDKVEFLGVQSEMDQLYSACGLFVLSSRAEGFGLVLLEAMNNGARLVAFACSAAPIEMLQGGVGRLVPNGDYNALADAIIETIKADHRSDSSPFRRSEVLQRHKISTVAAQWETLLNRIQK
jgi:glycosyltransferase involved in cell wall biosynthesis